MLRNNKQTYLHEFNNLSIRIGINLNNCHIIGSTNKIKFSVIYKFSIIEERISN